MSEEIIPTGITKNSLVIQHNRLVRSRLQTRLSAREQKILLMCFSCIQRDDDHTKRYQLKISDVFGLLDYEQDNYTEIKRTIMGLKGKCFEYENDNIWRPVDWVEKPIIFKKKGVFEFGFDEIVHAFGKAEKEFTPFELAEIIGSKCSYSIKIFQLLKSVRNQRKKSITFSIEEFKKILGVDKVKAYKRFNNFKARVLDSSKVDMNENASITFDYKLEKSGRSYSRITLYYKNNSKAIEKKIDKAVDDVDKKQMLDHFKNVEKMGIYGVTEKNAYAWLKPYNEEQAQQIIDDVIEQVKSGKIKRIMAGGALKNQLETRAKAIEQETKEAIVKSNQEKTIKINKKYWDEHSSDYDISGNSSGAYLQPNKGGVILFNDSDFLAKIERYRVTK